jgi:hypothetical protein
MKVWLKKWWWTLLLGLALIGGALFFIFRGRKGPSTTRSFSQRAREKILETETDAAIARERARAKSEAQKARLAEIEKVKDAPERRKRLADYLDEIL